MGVNDEVKTTTGSTVTTSIALVSVALPLKYVIGRFRPWRRLGDWAEDQVRFAGPWLRGGTVRQAVLVLAHGLARPRASWRILRTPPDGTRVPAPVRDPHWVEQRLATTGDTEEGSADHVER